MIALLFVCLGNICRSPALMGYMNHLALQKNMSEKIYADSCGLDAHFLGAPPDQRIQIFAQQRGIFFAHKAKLFEPSFFDFFQEIFGVTKDIVSRTQSFARTEKERQKVHLVTGFSEKYRNVDIPDPYYLGESSFERIWDMIEDSCKGIYRHFIEIDFKSI